MRLLLLALFVTYVTAAQLGRNRCAWGPSYWCSRINNAKECKAVDHCMSTVWKNQIIHPKATKECLYCQMGFNELKEILQNQDIQSIVAKYVADICSILPDPDWKKLCDGIVDEDLPILIKMLDEKIDSEIICAAMGICSGLEDTYSPYGVLAQNKGDQKPANSTCVDCKKFFQDVQQSITSQETQNQLEQLFNQVICNRLKGFSSVCQDVVKTVLPQVLQFLADQLDPDISCRVFGFCVSYQSVPVIPIKNIFKDLKQPLTYRSSIECEACEDFMTEIVNLLRDQNTQAVVKSDLETYVCNNLGGLADECKQLVEEYLPMGFELLVNELDPKTVCETVGVCQVPTYRLMAVTKLETGNLRDYSSEICDLCEAAVGVFDNFLKGNETVQIIGSVINGICQKLPSTDLQQQCLSFVSEYLPMVLNDLIQVLDPKTVCTDVELCAMKTVPLTLKQKDATCDLCTLGVTFAKNLLANISTEELLKDIKSICTFLPGNLSATCLTYVDEYVPVAIDLIKAETPEALCQLLGVCTTTVVRPPYMTKPIPEDIKLVSVDKMNKVASPTEICELCDTLILVLKELLQNNATEEEILDKFKEFCSDIPSFTQYCDSLVQTYGKVIIQLLLNDTDPYTICKAIDLCKSTVSSVSLLQSGILSPVDTLPININEGTKGKQQVEGSVECESCLYFMTGADKALQDKTVQAAVKGALLAGCKRIKSLDAECENLINTYYMAAINYLILSQSPEAVCKELKLCPAAVKLPKPVGMSFPAVSSHNVNAGPECVICEFVLKELDNILEENATKAEIEKAFEKVCGLFPSTISAECKDFVTKYGEMIIELLVSGVSPEKICTTVGLCTSDSMVGLAAMVNILPAKGQVSAVDLCPECELAIQALRSYLSENETVVTLEQILDQLCNMLPDTVSAQCDDVVKEYVPAILALLESGLSPKEVCQEFGFCNSTAGLKTAKEQYQTQKASQRADDTLYFRPHNDLLGANKCTYGPAFWCANKENAKKCNAVAHCEKHVWN